MHKIVSIIALAAGLSLPSFAGDYSVTVTGTVQILPAAGLRAGLRPWVESTAYTNGATVGANGQGWMCLVAGTSGTSNGPSGTAQITEGSVTWIPIIQPRRGGWYLKNLTSASRITKGVDLSVSASYGFPLDYLDALLGGTTWQDGVFVYGTNSLISFGEYQEQ